MELLFGIVLLALVGVFVLWPFLGRSLPTEDPELADLEAGKEAKYRELRDVELDHAAGKLNDDEYERQRAVLRREAGELLEREDRAKKRRTGDRG